MRAIGYVRVSTTEQAVEGVSLDAQQARLAAYCTFKGLDLVEVIIDSAVSAGRPLAKRPDGRRLANLVHSGAVDAVVSCKLDRLFRDAADCLAVTRSWDEAGVALHLLDLGVDTTTPMGRAFLTMAVAFAELERNLVAERTRDGLAQVKAEGGTLGGEAYGWARLEDQDDHGRLVCAHVETELAVIERIAAMRGRGETYQTIADALAADGVPTKRGGRWYPATVRNIALRAATSS